MLRKINKKTLNIGLAAVFGIMPLLLIIAPNAQGASLTNTYVRLNRMKTAETTSVRLVFKAATSQTANVTVDFQAAWTGASGVVNGTQSVSSASCAAESGATALPGTLAASGTGTTVTITGSTALTATTTYCVDLTSTTAVTNPTAGEYSVVVGHGADSVTVAVRVIAEDQVAVTAAVAPTFNFAFNNTTTDAFGNLSTAGVSTTGKTITLTTNAYTGWIVWAKSATNNGSGKGSLNSVAAGGYKIAPSAAIGSASHTLSASTEDYGLATTINTDAANGGTVVLDAAFDGTGTKVGVLDAVNFRPIASSNGTAAGDIINVLERATIKGDTPAANDYTDTLTFIGAGNF